MNIRYLCYRLGVVSSYDDSDKNIRYRRTPLIQGLVVFVSVVTPQLIFNRIPPEPDDHRYLIQIILIIIIYLVLAFFFYKGKGEHYEEHAPKNNKSDN